MATATCRNSQKRQAVMVLFTRAREDRAAGVTTRLAMTALLYVVKTARGKIPNFDLNTLIIDISAFASIPLGHELSEVRGFSAHRSALQSGCIL